MGILVSRFKSKKTTLEILESLENRIKSVEETGLHTAQRQRKIVGHLILYSVGVYVVAAVLFYFLYFPASLQDQLFSITPLVIFPIIVVFMTRLVTWYYRRKLTRNQEKLHGMREEKKKLLEDVMDNETYKIAKQILEKYAPDHLQKSSSMAMPARLSGPPDLSVHRRTTSSSLNTSIPQSPPPTKVTSSIVSLTPETNLRRQSQQQPPVRLWSAISHNPAVYVTPSGQINGQGSVPQIMETLGLVECSDTRTANLSGGQRKRLSIALELVNNPPVMFFDEPTSGLDSSSCFQCLSLLKSLARGGRTIICTIHQPSARLFEMFDHLFTLAEGQCIYQGSVQGLIPYLSSLGLKCPSYHNPADYVMEIACGEHGECIPKLVMAVNGGKCNNLNQQQLMASVTETCIANDISKDSTNKVLVNDMGEHKAGGPVPVPVPVPVPEMTCTTSLLDSDESLNQSKQNAGFPTSSFLQFYILLKRTFLSTIRDQTLTQMRFLSHVIVGLLIGMIYFGIGNEASKVVSNSGCIFFTVLFLMFSAMMPTILTFPVEMAVFVREHLNYWYSLKSFYFAKTMADLPFQVVFSIIYVLIVYFMTSQPPEVMRFMMLLTMCILTSLVAQSLGFLIGAAMNVENGVFFGPMASVPILLFSGFFVNFNTIPGYLQWVPYISYVRYGFEGAMISIYGYGRQKLSCSEAYCHFRNPAKFLEEMDMATAEYWIDAVALAGFFLLIRCGTYFVLRLKLHSKK